LHWSVNDANTIDLLPELRDNEWHLIRRAIPSAGFVDFRASRDGVSEASAIDLELHDPCIVRVDPMPIPEGAPLQRSLTICVADLAENPSPGMAVAATRKINDMLPFAGTRLQWIVITPTAAAAGEIDVDIPANVRVHLVDADSFTRASAAGLVTPYQPIDQVLLLEAADLSRCLEEENLEIIRAAVASASWAGRRLSLDPLSGGFWADDERGRFMSVAHRIGQPIPFLDREVILECLNAKVTPQQRKFAVIETDLVGSISHHGVVTKLFLEGAEQCGFRPVLGLNRRSQTTEPEKGNFDYWTGFGSYVYTIGIADDFTDELAAFIEAKKLGPDDLIFMHSLSPQIVLGAARFVAGHPDTSPTFAMRFFSTAEAMAGHKLSYKKILQSIEAVEMLRRKMHFFCESENLISYYEKAIGRRYPLLLNPEHPSLTTVRNCDWTDAGIGDRRHPTLAYFGEARAEKGFDFVPTILADLLADPSVADFHFIVQTGSNSVNRTAEMEQAKAALLTLRKAYPGRIRCFESVDTQEQFYFLMKHATGVIAPYRPESYGVRGTGVTLEALQMGLDVFAWVDTDLYATFKHTGRVVGVAKSETFAQAIVRHYREPPGESGTGVSALRQVPEDICRRLVSLCIPSGPTRESPPVLWVGNDTFGEGCSNVYAAQKLALREIGCDYLELFVPWPAHNLRDIHRGAYDEKIYGFDSAYNCTGLAWVARPDFGTEMNKVLATIEKSGPTYSRLRELNAHMFLPESLRRAIQACDIRHTILNYVHLYPAISDIVPREQVVIETHDIISYAHAVRRGEPISLTEKIDEFSDLRLFPQIVAISADEQREMESACPASEVYWRLPPYIPELTPGNRYTQLPMMQERLGLNNIPDAVTQPTPNMLATYYLRSDLQEAFSLGSDAGRVELFRWWLFIGQFEFGGQLDLTPAQCEWLLYPVDDGSSNMGLTGHLQLILSWRADLRSEFTKGATVDVAALAAWEIQNAAREFGFSREDLLALSDRVFPADGLSTGKIGPAFDAIVRARPVEIRGTFTEIRASLQNIAELEAIDLALVGSDHPANIESFQWFIDQVFLPYVAPTGRNLFIAGSVCKQLARDPHRNIFLLGRCEHIEPILRASRACPLPVIAGSGSPIKTIPAMVVNGAITVTDRIEQAFRLSEYGIPSFSHPKAFADDLNRLLTDDDWRADRVQRARRYANDVLRVEDYVEFWRKRLGAPPARPKPAVIDVSEPISIMPMIRKSRNKQRKH
jgi:glycosyltransferase involved in cell wall biosynthesis